jgi:large subunit ribosomal protein L3
MAIGLVGRKCGMTRIFTDAGVSVPVTVIEVDPNRITQIKTLETDGYQAIQITTGERRESRVTNARKVTRESGCCCWSSSSRIPCNRS